MFPLNLPISLSLLSQSHDLFFINYCYIHVCKPIKHSQHMSTSWSIYIMLCMCFRAAHFVFDNQLMCFPLGITICQYLSILQLSVIFVQDWGNVGFHLLTIACLLASSLFRLYLGNHVPSTLVYLLTFLEDTISQKTPCLIILLKCVKMVQTYSFTSCYTWLSYENLLKYFYLLKISYYLHFVNLVYSVLRIPFYWLICLQTSWWL